VDLVGHSRLAEEAIAQISKEKPDLIIVEEILSIGWGMDVVLSVASHAGVPRPAVIMVSTMPPPRIPDEHRDHNIDLWLQLPADNETLRSALDWLTKFDAVASVAAWREKLEQEGAMHKDRTNGGTSRA
jgi:DNA-binding NarL/FixJ family response regulator